MIHRKVQGMGKQQQTCDPNSRQKPAHGAMAAIPAVVEPPRHHTKPTPTPYPLVALHFQGSAQPPGGGRQEGARCTTMASQHAAPGSHVPQSGATAVAHQQQALAPNTNNANPHNIKTHNPKRKHSCGSQGHGLNSSVSTGTSSQLLLGSWILNIWGLALLALGAQSWGGGDSLWGPVPLGRILGIEFAQTAFPSTPSA
jgi:hypothetical protein